MEQKNRTYLTTRSSLPIVTIMEMDMTGKYAKIFIDVYLMTSLLLIRLTSNHSILISIFASNVFHKKSRSSAGGIMMPQNPTTASLNALVIINDFLL